jgi:hypothetical protein
MRKIQQSVFSGTARFAGLMVMALLALTTTASASGLSGKYTIDPTKAASSTNYTSFNDADSDLTGGARANGATANGPGVTATVTFSVADGIYNESVEIPAITGASSTSTINFESKSKDSSKVTIVAVAGGTYSAPGFVIHLNNASYINFKEIGMQMTLGSATYSYYDDVVIVDNVSDYNTFDGCMMVGPYSKTVTSYGSIIYSGYNYSTSSYSQDNYNVFHNNYMKNGYYGFYWLGSFTSGGAENGTTIDHNTIDSMGYYGMLLYTQDSIVVTNNKINMPYGNYAMTLYYLGYSYYGNAYNNLIANNFVSLNGATTDYGIYAYYVDKADIVYNNVNIYGSAPSSSYASYIYGYSTTNLTVYDNNFITGNGYAMGGNNFTAEDHNNLVSGGSNLVNYAGTSYSNLAAWKANTLGFATNDTSIDPIYVSNTDLHVNAPSLNGTGAPIASVTTDIDGEVRNPSKPDIGADEFTPPALSGGVKITAPSSGFCAGTRDVYVNFTNSGLNTITSATISWSVDGTAQTSYSYKGSLASGASTSIKIGSYAFTNKTHTYTVVSTPTSINGTTFTPTIRSTSTVLVRSGLNGTFTIDNTGSTTPDYTTFHAAVTDLNNKGLCGVVIYNVHDGYYNESVSLNTIPGASATNTVTFNGNMKDSTKVHIDTSYSGSYSSPGYTIGLFGASYVTFQHMTITNYITSSYGYGSVAQLSNGASHNTFNNNAMMTNTGTTTYNYGAVIGNSYGSFENYTNIHDNYIAGAYYTIQLQGAYNSAGEIGNVIYHNMIDSSNGYSIYCQSQDSFTISRNNVFTPSGYAGIYIYNYGVTGTDTNVIVNNFITANGSYSYGLLAYYCSLLNVYYNSVNNSTTSSYYYTAYFYNYTTGGVVNNLDNIYVNTASGTAISSSSTGLTNSDYNDLYSVSGNVGNWNGTSCATLSDWQKASSMDANSVSADPLWKDPSTGDLHLTSKSTAVAHKGIYIGGINNDIDSQSRSSKPNMGADETTPVKNSAGITSIDSPAVGFCSGTKDIYVTLTNFGSNVLSSVDIHWIVNGTPQTTYSFSGTLAAYASTSIKLGSITFPAGSSRLVEAYTRLPNGLTVTASASDSSRRNIGTSLSGVFTIGGTSPSFATFRAAVNALNANGVCGPVTFNVRDGYYNESVLIKAIAGSSSVNTVTFQSQSLDSSKVTVDTAWAGSYSARGYVFMLAGANWVNIRKMTLTNYGTASYYYSDVVGLFNTASHNIIENNIIATTPSTTNYGCDIDNNYGTLEQYNTIRHNQVSGAYYGIQMAGSYGSTGAEFGNDVNHNYVDSVAGYGILNEYQDSLMVYNNRVTLSGSNYSYGMYFYGMVTNGGNDTTQVYNNFVTDQASNGTGIYCYYSTVDFYFNSVNASNSSTYGGAGYFYNYSSGTVVNLVDNILSNDNGGYAIYASGASGLTYSDFNDLYSTGNIGYWSGTTCATLSDWQSASSLDANSVSVDPAFNNTAIGDLHLTALSSGVMHKGTPLLIKTDYDGEKRGSVPNLGGDETRALALDASVRKIDSPATAFCSGTKNIYARIGNEGSTAITSATISWSVNGTAQTPYKFSGTIAAGTFTSVKLGSITFTSGVPEKVLVVVTKPNGAVDSNSANDSVTHVFRTSLNGTYTIGGTSPSFGTFHAAVTAISNFGICGPVTFNVRDGYYNESVLIKNISGSSAVNTITFQSSSLNAAKVILDSAFAGSYAGRGYAVQLNGANYVTFRYMSITNSNSSYGYSDAVLITNGSNHNVFEYNVIADAPSTSNYGAVVDNNSVGVDQYNRISYNQINNGYYGIEMIGGYSAANHEMGNVVNNNMVDSANYVGILIEYQDSTLISANQVLMTSGYYPLYIYGTTSNGTGLDSSFVVNNMVSSSASYCYGLYSSSNDMLNIYHNSVNVSTSSSYYPAAYLYGYSAGTVNIVNNVFVNAGNGSALYGNANGMSYSNFNDFYTSGSTLAVFGGSSYSTLSGYQGASSLDANSVSGDPMYNSPSTGDLHATSSSTVISNVGTPLSSVTTDFDGNTRSVKSPDMGADEFSSAADDIGVAAILTPSTGDCGNLNQIVKVKISNYGSSDETGFNVKITMSNGTKSASATVAISGTLHGSSSTLAHDSIIYAKFSPAFNTSAGGTYKVVAYTDLTKDADKSNDSQTVSVTISGPPTAGLSVSKACAGLSFNVTDASSLKGSGTYRYYLVSSAGKIDSSSSRNPVFKAAAGVYRVVQGVYTTGGCYDSTSSMVVVNANPTASFSVVNSACTTLGDTTYINDASSGTSLTYNWNFGNGTTGAIVGNQKVVYGKAGLETITLTVTNGAGCSDSTRHTANVEKVDASFSHSSTGIRTEGFTATDATLSKYTWNYGDASTPTSGTSSTASHTYAADGKYTASLTATNTDGCVATWSDSVRITTTGISEAAAGTIGMSVYPNPFIGNTNIAYSLDKAASVKLEVFDMLGRTVSTLVDHAQAAGQYTVKLDNSTGVAGMYFVRMTVGNTVITRQVNMIK